MLIHVSKRSQQTQPSASHDSREHNSIYTSEELQKYE